MEVNDCHDLATYWLLCAPLYFTISLHSIFPQYGNEVKRKARFKPANKRSVLRDFAIDTRDVTVFMLLTNLCVRNHLRLSFVSKPEGDCNHVWLSVARTSSWKSERIRGYLQSEWRLPSSELHYTGREFQFKVCHNHFPFTLSQFQHCTQPVLCLCKNVVCLLIPARAGNTVRYKMMTAVCQPLSSGKPGPELGVWLIW